MEETIEVTVSRRAKLYYSEDSSWGIFKVGLLEPHSEVEFNSMYEELDRTITLKGSMPMLDEGKTYIATVSMKKDAKYGIGYEVKSIYEKLLSTRAEIEIFLKTILSSRQAESLLQAYPDSNIVELIKEDKVDLSRVYGIGEITLRAIKQKIIENEKYQKAIVEISHKYDIPYKSVKYLSEKYGSPDVLVMRLQENPYLLLDIDGYGFKKADEIAMKMGIAPVSLDRVNACVNHLVDEEANSGHAWTKKNSITNKAIKLLNIRLDDVEKVFAYEKKTFQLKDGIVYKERYLNYEVSIKNNLLRLLNTENTYIIENIEQILNKVEEEQGFNFTDEQRNAIELAIKTNVVVINGKAGTGKTSIIKGIVAVLRYIEGLGYATCALSGKASQRIQESTGLNSYTIHRLLGSSGREGVRFLHNENNRLPFDIVILDEGSMVNSEIFSALVEAIEKGSKLIIAGDISQLEAIGVGNVLSDLLESKQIPSVELTIVHRQAQKSGILSSANKVRDGIRFFEENISGRVKIGELQDLFLRCSQDDTAILKNVLKVCSKYKGNILEFQVLCPLKKRGLLSTNNLNTHLQKIFNPHDESDFDSSEIIKRKESVLLVGDKIISNGNNYEKNVFNGTIGIIQYIDTKKEFNGKVVGEIVIEFEGIGNVSLTNDEVKAVDLAYAISVHKSQGSQWKYVVLAISYSAFMLLNRQLLYTAMTRAKEYLFIEAEMKALIYAIANDKATKRRTFIPSLFMDEKSCA